MFAQRTVRLQCGQANQVLHVLGTQLRVDLSRCAPHGTKFFKAQWTDVLDCRISPGVTGPGEWPLAKMTSMLVSMGAPSKEASDAKVSVSYFGATKEELGKAILHITSIGISLDVDADRDGVVEKNNPNKSSWKWGPKGHGAILLVNCDTEEKFLHRPDFESNTISKLSDLEDMSRMILRVSGPKDLSKDYKLMLHISQGDADKIKIFQAIKNPRPDYSYVLGQKTLSHIVKYEGEETVFFVEGCRFPDEDFDGLVTIYLSVLEPLFSKFPETPIFMDKVVFRIAPWIMTPNILKPIEVYVCSTFDNSSFRKGLKEVVDCSSCKLKVCSWIENRGDRWMQDELEFGYIDSPHKSFPVVLDSPRDRGLKEFPYRELLGPDFGYVTRMAKNETVTSLDSFGNLEVSPPVTVNGKQYPLGRIIIGCAFPTAESGRNMTRVVQNFLRAQKVQEPIALFSDWLFVGHVDEFMTFVPAPNRKGFRLLLASPDAGIRLFQGLQKTGNGTLKMFQGIKTEEVTVDQILSNKTLQKANTFVQSCIDWNRDVLKKELALEEEDIIDLPILFTFQPDGRAVAYYPDMVNMIVLGKNLGIPKPYGPQINGKCVLEEEVRSLLSGLGLNCTFIDDFASYHKNLGEVHCGSNVRRETFTFKWWNMEL
ncbi:protein-arginine deiminase type-2 [Erpetoichthys calabaricus]|uniref:protein-arginine deiminase n=1 Tax=Erpetoichthys calabaricus TaxID=27687 RepID=A0A8C4S562_ERPCA|nr:protein-arginine deiminase type-2 [Erpetoichthys calabaricus]